MHSCLRIYIHVYNLCIFQRPSTNKVLGTPLRLQISKPKRCENSCCPAAEVPQRLPSVSYSDLTEIMGIVFMKGLLTLFNHEKPLRAYEPDHLGGAPLGLGWLDPA